MEIRKGKVTFEGITAESLIKEYGSPLYVYEAKTIRDRAERLTKAINFKNKMIKYACKANTNIEIMKILKEYDTGVDAVSPGEIFAALTAGYRPEDILFTVTNPSWDEIQYAIDRKVLVNLDSLSVLSRFGREFPGYEVCVRINPDVGAGHHSHVITGGPESKFGISYRDVQRIKEISSKYGLKIKGIHQHIGSGILEPEMFIKAMDVLLKVALEFEDLEFVDFGGGIGVPYKKEDTPLNIEELGKRITNRFQRFCSEYGKEVQLMIEPGRFFVAESGFLLATVQSVKQEERHLFIGVDTGFNHLIRPAMYGSYHEIYNGSNSDGTIKEQVIAGNICESGDTFTRDENGIVDRPLPEFREGDIVCIANAGAYGYSMASQYNSRPRPAEVLIENRESRLIRKRDTIEEIFRNNLNIQQESVI